jgi:hypothetical protein
MKKTIANRIFFLSLISLLSGCSVYKGSFGCKPHKGVGCESVSRVNELINDNELDEFIANRDGVKKTKKCGCQSASSKELAKEKSDIVDEAEKITIHFNEYKEKGVIYKESEIEVGAK